MRLFHVLGLSTFLIAAPAFSAAVIQQFEAETSGAEPSTFSALVGEWIIIEEGSNKRLSVNGTGWESGQPASGLNAKARNLYGDRYKEFRDNVKEHADFPVAILNSVADFRGGTITVRFKGIAGRVDQAAGILFDVQPNGDYLTLRANCLEDNLVLFKYVNGSRSSVKWVKNAPTATAQWHELKLTVQGSKIEGRLDGKLTMTHDLGKPISGRIGLWSKADSVMYFDDYAVVQSNP